MASAIASRYAKALVDLALAPGSELNAADAAGHMRAFEELYWSSPELEGVLLSPAVPGPRKRAVIDSLTKSLGIPTLIRNFLYVVIDHRRVAELSNIREAFETLLDERTGVVRVDVASAREMKESEREALRNELSLVTGKQVRAQFGVDAALLGGAVAHIGSTIYDGSLKGQLEALRVQLESE